MSNLIKISNQKHALVPKIYIYTDKYNQPLGRLKVGMTTRKSAEIRIKEQTQTASSQKDFVELLWEQDALTIDNCVFSDHAVHRKLVEMGIKRLEGEWFQCTVDNVKTAIMAIQNHKDIQEGRVNNFAMRPEQQKAVDLTADYFKTQKNSPDVPHFLWNAKMRFGKTFATYKLAQKMGWTKILILTYKPAVASAWQEDLDSHIDFEDWQFVDKNTSTNTQNIDINQKIAWFASFQDILGKDRSGQIKEKNEIIHLIDWDCVVLDEYHFGSWNTNSKELYNQDKELEKIETETQKEMGEDQWTDFEQNSLPLTVKHFLYLSGTPFRAVASGEFLEDQIFNWTYSDEQRAKTNWIGDNNPYSSLPQIQMLTYRLPDRIRDVATKTDKNGFSLNEFFRAQEIIITGKNDELIKTQKYQFVYEKEVQQWLNILRGQEKMVNDPTHRGDVVLPFEDVRLLGVLNHTFWFLPTVASCKAMKDLLGQRQNNFYGEYQVLMCAGTEAGIGEKALLSIKKAIGNGLTTKTITLSCGKLTTGVSVPQWGGVFFLRDTTSPESYFQTAFRAQTPWTLPKTNNKTGFQSREILKKTCFIFDFAPNRALNLIVDYTAKLDIKSGINPEKKITDFINFLPVLCFEGEQMEELNATNLLDMATSGIVGTMLARKWQSPLMVDVSDYKLTALLDRPELIEALEKMEDFRNLKTDISKTITSEKAIQKLKKQDNLVKDKELPVKEQTEKKENQSFKKKLKENLLKFITKIPIFMYLTSDQEATLKEVIEQLESELFTKVTGLSMTDFEMLCEVGVFNESYLNESIFAFRRYEDSSLNYLDSKAKDANGRWIYGWNTSLPKSELDQFTKNIEL